MRSVLALVSLGLFSPLAAQDLRRELGEVELRGAWVYDDLAAGVNQARRSGKPLLVVFR